MSDSLQERANKLQVKIVQCNRDWGIHGHACAEVIAIALRAERAAALEEAANVAGIMGEPVIASAILALKEQP